MNLVAPHLLVELRSAGFIEICADLDEENDTILTGLDGYFADRFQATRIEGHEDFCDRYYQAGDEVFKGSGGSLDSNFGLLCTDVCDLITKYEGWSLVACNAGNYGADGRFSEQQMIFRRDYHPLGDSKYLQVILNALGNIEVNGQHVREIHSKLDGFLRKKWGCERSGQFREGETMCRRYTWDVSELNMLRATAEVVTFFELQGWEIQVASQQQILEDGTWCREQQLLFRPGRTEVGTVEPHVFIELYAGEGSPEFFEDEDVTQVLANQRICLRAIGPGSEKKRESPEIRKVKKDFEDFVISYLGGETIDGTPGENTYACNVFLCRGKFENNLAQWTMRLCDCLVDKLGWSFIVSSLCNMGEFGQNRMEQLIFRFDGDKRALPVSKVQNNDVTELLDSPFPEYWSYAEVLEQQEVQRVRPCVQDEKEALQALVDATFRRVLTRDRVPDDDAENDEEMPYRIEVVHAFRSEHAWLHHRLYQSRQDCDDFDVKTCAVETLLQTRLTTGEAYLFHGTNPSSAMSILKTGFVLDHAGSATGTMYGAGIYLAECSSKSDEYGRDDGGNTYPSLHAMLVCKCFVGTPYVTDKAGDHVPLAREAGNHCICGDRESKVGTYREFVFFDEQQVYPEYAIIYRRQYDKTKVPEEMVLPTSGTTGRGDFGR